VGARRRVIWADLILLQHHEIKMLNPFFGILAHALLERHWVHYITHVLVYESVSAKNMKRTTHMPIQSDSLGKVLLCSQPVPLLLCEDNFNVGILFSLKSGIKHMLVH
jgi:hypothetical protein